MRRILAVLVVMLLAFIATAVAQEASSSLYTLEQDKNLKTEAVGGVRKVTVKYTLTPNPNPAPEALGKEYQILVIEEGKEMLRLPVPKATTTQDLSVMLTVDTSESMSREGRMDQAREASKAFLQLLPRTAEAGLLLFNHEIRKEDLLPLQKDRQPLLDHILRVRPGGGTAFLDAASKATRMVGGVVGRQKYVVVMTDGVDMNSEMTLERVIADAKEQGVKVYTVGIGEPGKGTQVTSMLALDVSGSMNAPANDQDRVPKIAALKEAATQFLTFLRKGTLPGTNEPIVRTSVLKFSDEPGIPHAFTNNKDALRTEIAGLKAKGETSVFDATYEAVAALEAVGAGGKRAVIAMTDGVDNKSRRRADEVIARAKAANIPLYMLGFGRDGEIDATIMKQMATETKGRYYHAKNQKALKQIFEDLSLELHHDGIDEASLRRLAEGTGGKYYPAKDVSQLQLILQQVVKALEREEKEATFISRFGNDGLEHPVEMQLISVDRSGAGTVEQKTEATYQLHGLVLPEINQFVYLGMLGLLGALLALPAGLRRIRRTGS